MHILVTKEGEQWIPLQKTFPLIFFPPPPFSAMKTYILFAIYISALLSIWAQFDHVGCKWMKTALKSFCSKGRREMAAPGDVQSLGLSSTHKARLRLHRFLRWTTELRAPSHALVVAALPADGALPWLVPAPQHGCPELGERSRTARKPQPPPPPPQMKYGGNWKELTAN